MKATMSAKPKPTGKPVSVWLSSDAIKRVKREAKANGSTQSAVVARCIDKGLPYLVEQRKLMGKW